MRSATTGRGRRLWWFLVTGLAVIASASVDTAASPNGLRTSGIDGTWRVSYTRAEFAQAGAHVEELGNHRENWGTFVLRFRGGAWAGTKQDAPRGPSGKGTYVVKGPIVTINKLWQYRWKITGNALTLRKVVPGANVPTGFTVKPWHRVQ